MYPIHAFGFLMAGGRAADIYGSRRLFASGLALFGVASLICGLASAAGTLIAARALQGLGAALAVAVGLAIGAQGSLIANDEARDNLTIRLGSDEKTLARGDAAKLMVQSGWCGWYFSVRETGTIAAGESFTITPGPHSQSMGIWSIVIPLVTKWRGASRCVPMWLLV